MDPLWTSARYNYLNLHSQHTNENTCRCKLEKKYLTQPTQPCDIINGHHGLVANGLYSSEMIVL